jgi:cell division topological specificity factor
MWSLLDSFFRNRARQKTAGLAKERLSIIVAREGRAKGAPNYLPQLKRELLEVLAKYEKIDLEQVSVNVADQGDCEVLELNVILGSQDDDRRTPVHAFESRVPPRPNAGAAPIVPGNGKVQAVREATPFFEKLPAGSSHSHHHSHLS